MVAFLYLYIESNLFYIYIYETGHMQRDGDGSRFVFYQGKPNGEYLLWLHSRLFELGYCAAKAKKSFL